MNTNRNYTRAPAPHPNVDVGLAMAYVATIATTRFGVTVQQLLSDARAEPFGLVRAATWLVVREEVPGATWTAIAAAFGRHHSTCVVQVERLREMIRHGTLAPVDVASIEHVRERSRAMVEKLRAGEEVGPC